MLAINEGLLLALRLVAFEGRRLLETLLLLLLLLLLLSIEGTLSLAGFAPEPRLDDVGG